ncbi:prosaposin isoform X2 [Coccinella septempunctata]|uniref:prosaposin isoform X2 n=1 Tax=Coccinella septempunctata TaxID=41139 RepID=UPI001D0686AF|nr:prosaposin isoform X2 [Coccinella septempunctata]
MKVFIFVVVCLALAQSSRIESPLLGAKECTWGPSYWCKNLTSAASCHATKHCIQTDWIHRQLPPDNSSICQTCLDMVKQARDQLLSNETQELIKQVFEGTCSLIHFKPIVKECDKIVDNFIPDLIDTLASEMNPQVVCSVAGLCNNEEYLKSLEHEDAAPSSTLKPSALASDVTPCEGCQTVVSVMEAKFNAMSKDEILHGFLMMCRHTGSLSDACSNIILTYFTEIYEHIKDHLNPGEVCVLSGQCSALFHRHDEPDSKGVQITPISHIGFVPVNNEKDDPTCEFCEQLVKHLRDLLVANTTEEEFKKVMEALCKQTRSFSDECVGLVDEYYPIAYQFLLEELNGTVVCAMIGICPRGSEYKNVPIVPLLPAETADALEISPATKKPGLIRVPLSKNSQSIQIISNPAALGELGKPEDAQLPIDLLIPTNNQLFNKQVCEFCQFFLHYVQQAITDPKTEDQIKYVIERACNDLPSSVNQTCRSFVETYEPAFVALLAQEIDPSQICPLVRACPSEEVRDVDVFMQQETGDNSKCPLCLFAVQKLEEMVKNNKTEADIKEALGRLCSKLPKELASECQQFVDTYTDELVEMLIADLNPQEVCVYLKLCTDNKPAPEVMKPLEKPVMFSGQIDTNAILDNTYDGVIVDVEPISRVENVGSVECFLCKKVVQLSITEIKDINDKQAVIDFMKHICPLIPDVNNEDCYKFIQKYGDQIIKFLIDGVVAPYEICSFMQLCAVRELQTIKVEIFDCPVCEAAVWAMEKIMANPKVDHGMKHVLEKTCRALPARDQAKCRDIIEKYGTEIFDLMEHMINKKKICRKIGVCRAGTKVMMETDDLRMSIVY